ncbi:enoyl-CoA hydratase/isomerase family protein [Streptomyces sp. NPDC017988]|uniref:enoyl-CoA hydratase/isomerase family protein n=1 Tax=Streptomyces sp. NPDC017988 TaxID=3365025 RepID=UPI00378F1CDE
MTAWEPRSGHIDVSVRDRVAVVTLDRPEKLNALTGDMRRELAALLRHFGDGRQVCGVVLTGTGRAFSAGEDLREAAATPPNGMVLEAELFHDITRAALRTRVPTVAALNGVAVGGAGEMTLSFDARLGTPEAAYHFPENGIGLTVTNAASVLLPRLVGAAEALRLVLDSARVDAQQALGIGLLDDVVAPDELVPAAIRLVRRWGRTGAATAAHLALLRPSPDLVEAALGRETRAVRHTEDTGSARAGIERFLAARDARR